MNVASVVSFVWDTKPDFPSHPYGKNLLDVLILSPNHSGRIPSLEGTR